MACTMLRKQTCIVPEDLYDFNRRKGLDLLLQGYMDNGSAFSISLKRRCVYIKQI